MRGAPQQTPAGTASFASIRAQEPAARLLGVFDLFSTTPISDFLFPNRGPLHYIVGSQEDQIVRALSGQLQPGEELAMMIPGAPLAQRGIRALVPRSFEALAPNRGFLGGFTTEQTLARGAVIDRYGYRGGYFASPQGTPFSARGLPPEYAELPFEAFEVVEPLRVRSGLAGYSFGGGGGIQYELPESVQILIDAGILRKVK
jgi:hypothetical protein